MNGRDASLGAVHPQLVAALSAVPVAALLVDGTGCILYANPLLLTLFGYSAEALLFQPMELLLREAERTAHAMRRAEKANHYRDYAMGRNLRIAGRHRDGSEIAVEIKLQSNQSEYGTATVAFVSDRRQEQAKALELEGLNRTLHLVHECNGILVRARSERELLSGIAQSMVASGRYLWVWIALLPFQGDSFKVSLSAGQQQEGVREAGVTGGERIAQRALEHRVPLLLAPDELRTLAPALCPVPAGTVLPVLIALPLLTADTVQGCLCVASNAATPFTQQEVALLQDLADDLAFGLDTLHVRQQQARAESRLHLLERAVEASGNAVMITDSLDPAHPILYVNQAFERMSGYAASEVLGRSGRLLLADDLAQQELQGIRAALRTGREARALLRNYRKDGALFWNELTVAPVRDDRGLVTHCVSVLNDVTARKLQELQIERHSLYDALTGLPNRHLLFTRIVQGAQAAQRNGHVLGVLLIGLDRFALVNDAFGHDVGDALLRAVGARLIATLHVHDTVARLGGDEFVVLLSSQAADDALAVIERIRAALARPFDLSCGELVLSASIGVSFSPRDASDAQSLVRNAEVAMQGAKTGGLNAVRYYAEEMNRRTGERLAMEFDLRRALEKHEFELYYQPITDVQTGRIVEAEALLRWNRPQHGLVAPDHFIPLAESSGLIVPIGQWVLDDACRQNALWRATGLPAIRIGVNLSARQFREPGLDAMVAQALAAHGLAGCDLVLEVTESLLLTNVKVASEALLRLKQLGVQISLDDFGTGYSSLSYLKRLPLDTLKIDRSFVSDICTDANDAAITATIISMAATMHLGVIAEGVETREQLAYLRANGCQRAQGYLFSKPVPASQFGQLLAQWDGLAG